ncbi:DUF6702 family protein [Robiginitalea sp. IMCC44478]|uniref:DUF6702 family protein n=1 Tax=Robiginitalea sp. IMCC44478 TaxID=3459122 RepID=UPI004042F154
MITTLKSGFFALLVAVSVLSGLHKFYVSVTNVDYSEKDQAIQMISRVFIDDMEAVLLERYDFRARLATPNESAQANDYIEKYFKAKFKLTVNGKVKDYKFLGTRYENDLLICYMEVSGIEKTALESVGIENEVLTDLFEEQKNLVHFNILGSKKSVVLIRGNNKGMLNF